jgi:hypothetical protein
VLIALIHSSNINHSLIFSISIPHFVELKLKNTWDIPEEIMNRKFILYDNSVNTCIINRGTQKSHQDQLAQFTGFRINKKLKINYS